MSAQAVADFGPATPLKLEILRVARQFDGEFSAMDIQRTMNGRGESSTYTLLKRLTEKGWLTVAQAKVRPRTKGGSAIANVYTFTNLGRERAQVILGSDSA